MIEAVLSSLIVATVTGLTFVAYKHPSGYRRIHTPIIIVCGVITVGYMLYSIGHTIGFYEATRRTGELNKGQLIHTPYKDNSQFWVGLIPLVVTGYMSFLRALPSILDLPEPNKNRKPNDPVN